MDDSGKVCGGFGRVGERTRLVGSVGGLLGTSGGPGEFCGCCSWRFSGILAATWGFMGGLFSGGFC